MAELIGRQFGNLPAQLTSLIGREQEVAAACTLLQRPEVRLLTLTGTGGVGKTRLGLQVATDLLAGFADGVCFVSLAPISDPDLVIPTITQTLGLLEAGDRSSLDQLKVYLRERRVLLLLDNFEQVGGAAPRLTEVLEACPDLKMLVTSRASLRVSGEHEFLVPPLALPDLTQLPESEALTQYAAVALFLQRAKAIKPDFRLTQANARIIAEICTHLDGLPLAIELAAARIKVLSPQLLLARLEHRLQILTGGAQDMPIRQRTLHNTIAWSYGILGDEEQRLFRRLSVFVGGCTLEAAEAVGNGANDLTMDVLERAASLIDQSLLQQVEQTESELRFVTLETIREYGHECLIACGEAVLTQRAHANYYLSLAEKALPFLNGAEQLKWLDRLERDHDNLRAALNWLIEWKETEKALRLGAALWLFWLMHTYVSEGQRWLERALAGSNEGVSVVRAKALYAAARMAYYRSDYSRALIFNEESLKLYRALGDKRGIAVALNSLGHIALAQGDYAEVRTRCQESLPLLKEVGDRWRIAEALFLSAYESHARGDYTRAYALCEESLALCREVGDRNGTAQVLHALGFFAYHQHDFTAAFALHEESLAISREVGQKWLIAACLEGLGEVTAKQRQPAWAARLWGAAETLREIIGMPIAPAERTTYERAVTVARTQLNASMLNLQNTCPGSPF